MRILDRLLTILILLPAFFSVAGQGIRINEIMSSNSATIADEDGDYSDWIELYNSGKDTVDLQGWGLSDNHDKPFKWIFPHKFIKFFIEGNPAE